MKRINQSVKKMIPALSSIGIGLIVGYLILLATNPSQATNGFRMILTGGFAGGPRGVGNVLYYSIPLMMTGLGVAFAFQNGLFNIGGSGQFILGAYTAVFIAHSTNLPGMLAWLVPVFCAMLASALWAGIAAVLNAYFKVNIVISTIMLNYIAMYGVNHLIKITVYDVPKNQTLPVPAASILPKWGLDKIFTGSTANIGFYIAVLICILIYILLYKTTYGYEFRACGLNRDACRYAGMNEKRNIILAMAISGALIGIGGALMYLGDSGTNIKAIDTLAPQGFWGISVALLAQINPIAVIFSALFLSYIQVGGFYMQTFRFVPEIIDIITSVIIYFSAFSLLIFNFLDDRSRKRETEGQHRHE